MDGFDPKTSFGYDTSRRYVAGEARGDEEDTLAFLARLAGQQDALEFAVGTGRIALPLSRAGVPVHGIEQSQHMVDRMREKPDGDDIHVVIGDMASVDMGREYGLVYLVYNTIGNLLTQEDQVRCLLVRAPRVKRPFLVKRQARPAEGKWGGACARWIELIVCARAPGLTSVHDPRVGSGAGDKMFDGVIPLGEALRPLDLSRPSTRTCRQQR